MTAPRTTPARKVFGRLSLPERTFVADALRTETVGGVLLLLAAVTALAWVNIPALRDSYESVSQFHFGPEALGLDLSVAHWAADGLLAIFFFVAGIEFSHTLFLHSHNIISHFINGLRCRDRTFDDSLAENGFRIILS